MALFLALSALSGSAASVLGLGETWRLALAPRSAEPVVLALWGIAFIAAAAVLRSSKHRATSPATGDHASMWTAAGVAPRRASATPFPVLSKDPA